MRMISMLAVLGLAACTPSPRADVTMNRSTDVIGGVAMPPMQSFAGVAAAAPARSNQDIARDILDLQFQMESGRALPVLSRFEGPITIGLIGDVPATAPADLERLVRRFRTEAGLDVSIAPAGTVANVTVDFEPRSKLSRLVPNATCFVVPRVSSLAEYKANLTSPETDWTTVKARQRVAIFAPADTSPQEVRDCLHEEVAQAMGPLNDLYRLQDSVFNDDNFNTTLTGFDMLVLRVHYDGELRSGMNEAEVARRLPAILSRLNPAGDLIPSANVAHLSPRTWVNLVQEALGQSGTEAGHLAAAQRMLDIARAQGWRDNRLALSYFAIGRANVAHDMPAAVQAFAEAGRIYRSLPGGELHAAHVDMQLAAFALAQGEHAQAIALTDRAIPVAQRGEHAALLATLLMIRSESYDALGRTAEARRAHLDSLGWARYGFGTDAQIQARMKEIAGLAQQGARS